MPNKASSRKRVRQNERRRIRNRDQRSTMRSSVKKLAKIIESKDLTGLDAALQAAQSKLGKAAKRNLIKKNALSRKQSRLTKAVNRAKVAAASA